MDRACGAAYDSPMGKLYDGIDPALGEFIARQRMFFVATAPLASDGHVNLSPKGHDAFAILDPRTVAYLDLTGSGVETIAHLRENGRITICFCAFEGPPKILRLYGRGTVIEPGDADFATLRARFGPFDAVRSIVRVALTRIADSCGYGVPRYRYEGQRTQLVEWARRKGAEGVVQYRQANNGKSIDRLPGLRSPREAS
jgi:hypothetical protein